jgi:large subunit ribosomal protein L31
MPKKNIHPHLFKDSKVYCDGQLIMTVVSTRSRLDVDVWSGNHPFFTGSNKILDIEGRIKQFTTKYKKIIN